MARQKDIDRVRGLEKHLGLKPGECEHIYGEVDGEQTIERLAVPVEMLEELWDLRTLTTVLIKKLDIAVPKIDAIVGFSSFRVGQSMYDGPQLGTEIEALRAVLGLSKPAGRPQEFFPPDYCKRCEGMGKVPGGEGIRDEMTRRNMHRWATAVNDNERAVAWLLKVKAVDTDEEAAEMLAGLPLDIEYIGKRMVTAIRADGSSRRELMDHAQTARDADLSMFEIEKRRPDWNWEPERKWKDICPECRGTGNRGLPVPSVGYDAERDADVLATEVED